MQSQADRRRVVVTGLGCVTPLGSDVVSTWESAAAGRSGVRPLAGTDLDPELLPVRIVAPCDEDVAPRRVAAKEARRLDRCTRLALAAAEEAIDDARLRERPADPERVAVVVGTSIGGISTLLDAHDALRIRGARRMSPFTVPMTLPNMTAGYVSMHGGFRGPIGCPVGACASGAQALGAAARLLEHGLADVAIAGGTDAALHPLVMAGFAAMRALSTRNDDPQGASRPFDKQRDGFVLSEGAGALILEDLEHALARKALVYAELAGYGTTADAFRLTDPHPEGRGAIRAMRLALQDAGMRPEDIGYINAHGTSTELNDQIETLAVKAVFGMAAKRVPMSSIKSMLGHMIAAAGAVELIASTLTIREGLIPPTINYRTPDDACDLDYVPNQARKQKVSAVLSNSFGFGGQNVALIVKEYRP